jgi:hypothetical protein
MSMDHPSYTDLPDKDVKCGVATALWLTLWPYPHSSPPPDAQKLYLMVNENWRHLYLDHNYDDGNLLRSVQSAFCCCNNALEVVVWYRECDSDIVGLVVRSKYSLTECRDEP